MRGPALSPCIDGPESTQQLREVRAICVKGETVTVSWRGVNRSCRSESVLCSHAWLLKLELTLLIKATWCFLKYMEMLPKVIHRNAPCCKTFYSWTCSFQNNWSYNWTDILSLLSVVEMFWLNLAAFWSQNRLFAIRHSLTRPSSAQCHRLTRDLSGSWVPVLVNRVTGFSSTSLWIPPPHTEWERGRRSELLCNGVSTVILTRHWQRGR